jgi:glutamate racemase
LSSPKFLDLVDRHGAGVQVLVQPCPGLVEQIEAGELTAPRTRELVESLVRPLLQKGADTLVLGCTHYPFVRHLIGEVAGPDVAIIDPATAVARELRRRLDAAQLRAPEQHAGSVEFYSSGSPDAVAAVISHVWGRAVTVGKLQEPGS